MFKLMLSFLIFWGVLLDCYSVYATNADKSLGIIKRVIFSSSTSVIYLQAGRLFEGDHVEVYNVSELGVKKLCSGIVRSVYKDEIYITIDTSCVNNILKGDIVVRNYTEDEIKSLKITKSNNPDIEKTEEVSKDVDMYKIYYINRLAKTKTQVPFLHQKHNLYKIGCNDCHEKVKTADKEGFHIYCKGCHKKNSKGPVKCAECHKK